MLASTFQYLLPQSKSRRPERLICSGVLSCFTQGLNSLGNKTKNFIRKFLILRKSVMFFYFILRKKKKKHIRGSYWDLGNHLI